MARRERISWNANQTDRLRKAVSSYNAAVTRMEKSGKYDAVPNKTSMEREMSMIETRDELRQREKELGRILKKNKPDADEAVNMGSDEMPFVVPKYLDREIKLAARSINARRKKQRLSLFQDAGEVSKATELTRLSNKNLRDLDEEEYHDGDDLDDLWEELYPQTYKYAEQFKQQWLEYNGNPLVPEVIDYMAEYYPDELHLIFESGDDEVDINYIYPTTKSSDRTPMWVRHNRVLAYWNDVYRKYSGYDHGAYMQYESDMEIMG